jgi:hypothetical protein
VLSWLSTSLLKGYWSVHPEDVSRCAADVQSYYDDVQTSGVSVHGGARRATEDHRVGAGDIFRCVSLKNICDLLFDQPSG